MPGKLLKWSEYASDHRVFGYLTEINDFSCDQQKLHRLLFRLKAGIDNISLGREQGTRFGSFDENTRTLKPVANEGGI